MVAAGQLLARKYRVDRVLGEGGMGLLVAATDLSRHDRVALKLMRPEALQSPELVERFRREAATAARLTSANVVRVRDVGQLEGGAPYLAMELLEGEDVAAILARCGPMPVTGAIDIILQTCDALAEAHAMGIVHRDVSPANVFVARTPAGPVVKVLDFGVATAGPVGGNVSSMTRTGTVLGCPFYASPEQLQSSKHVDARSDLWSVGAVLYELLTGHPPYVADSLGGLLGAVMLTDPAKIRDTRPDVPPELEAVILRCLTRERDGRFASARELGLALAPFRAPPPSLRPPSPAPRSLAPSPLHMQSPVAAPRSSTWTIAVSVVLLALVVAAAVGVTWVHRHGGFRKVYQRTSAQPQ